MEEDEGQDAGVIEKPEDGNMGDAQEIAPEEGGLGGEDESKDAQHESSAVAQGQPAGGSADQDEATAAYGQGGEQLQQKKDVASEDPNSTNRETNPFRSLGTSRRR